MNATNRAILTKLVGNWPDIIPLTRSFVVACLYIMDREIAPGCLELDWQTEGNYYPMNQSLIAAMDKVGCLRPLSGTFRNNQEFRIAVNNAIPAPQQEALNIMIDRLKSCRTLPDALRVIKSRMSELMMEQRGAKSR